MSQRSRGKTGVVRGRRNVSEKEIGNLTNPSNEVASGKVFPKNGPAVNNSGNDMIIK